MVTTVSSEGVFFQLKRTLPSQGQDETAGNYQHNPGYDTPAELQALQVLRERAEQEQRQSHILQKKAEAEEKIEEVNSRVSTYFSQQLDESTPRTREITDAKKLTLEITTHFEFLKRLLFFMGNEKGIMTFMLVKIEATLKLAENIFEETKANEFLISKICNQMLFSYKKLFSEYLEKYATLGSSPGFQGEIFNSYISLIYHLFRVYEELFFQNPEECLHSKQYLMMHYNFVVKAFNAQNHVNYDQVRYEFDQLIDCLLKSSGSSIEYPSGADTELLQKVSSIQKRLQGNINQWNGEVIDALMSARSTEGVPPHLRGQFRIGKEFCYDTFEEMHKLESENFQVWGKCCFFHCNLFFQKNLPLLVQVFKEKYHLSSQHSARAESLLRQLCLKDRIRFIFAKGFGYLGNIRLLFNSQMSLEMSTQLVEDFTGILIHAILLYQLIVQSSIPPSNPNYQCIQQRAFIVMNFLLNAIEFIEKSDNKKIQIVLLERIKFAWSEATDFQGCTISLKEKMNQQREEHKQNFLQQPEAAEKKKEQMSVLLKGLVLDKDESPQRAPVARRSRKSRARSSRSVVEAPQERSITLTQKFERKCEEIQFQSWEEKRRLLMEFWKTEKPQNGNEYIIVHSKWILQVSQCYQLQIAEEFRKFEKSEYLDWDIVLKQKNKTVFLYKKLSDFLEQELEAHQRMTLSTMCEISKKHLKESNSDLQRNSQEIEGKYQDFCAQTSLPVLFKRMQKIYTITWDSLMQCFKQLQVDQWGVSETVRTHSDKLQKTLRCYQQFKEEILKNSIAQEQPIQEALQEIEGKMGTVKQAAENAVERSKQQRNVYCKTEKPQHSLRTHSSEKSGFTKAREELEKLCSGIERSLMPVDPLLPFSEKTQVSFYVYEESLFHFLNDKYTIPADVIEAMEAFSQRSGEEKKRLLDEFQGKLAHGSEAFGDAVFDRIYKYFENKMNQDYQKSLEKGS